MRAFRLVLLLAAALAFSGLSGCQRPDNPPVRIESVSIAGRLALTDDALAVWGTTLATAAPELERLPVADAAAALAAVRTGNAVSALVRPAPDLPLAGLRASDVASRAVTAFVPFTFPVEELTERQFLDLIAGKLTDWRETGGPALPVELGVRDAATVTRLGVSATAPDVADIGTWLAEGRGRVVLAPPGSGAPFAKALRVAGMRPGDDGYPTARWTLVSRSEAESMTALANALGNRATGAVEPEITLAAVGDIMLGRGVGETIAARGAGYPFQAVAPLLAGADVRIGNLELPLTERGRPASKNYVFRAPPSVVEGLTAARFDLLTLANNHALDYGAEGLLDTIATLERAGIAGQGGGRTAAEAYAPVILTLNGLRVAFLSYVNVPVEDRGAWAAESTRAGERTPGVAWGTEDAVRRDVAAAKSRADLVVVAIHAGWEYLDPPNPVQRTLAYTAVEAGAALVLGVHPHVLQGIELYRGVPVVYSLGNFIFDLDDDDRRTPGLPSVLTGVLRVRLSREGVRGLEFLPAIIDEKDGRPIPASGADARRVYGRLYTLTDRLSSTPETSTPAGGSRQR